MKLIPHLQQLGFTQYEAKTYIALLKKSPVTGYELAKMSGVPASKVYEVLNKLENRHFVLALEGDPKRYVPLPPEEVLARIQNRFSDSLNFLSGELEHIFRSDEHNQDYIWNIHGYQPILSKLQEMIGHTQSSLFVSLWKEEFELLAGPLEELNKSSKDIHIVLFGKVDTSISHVYRHGREHKIRQSRGGRRIAMVSDDEQMMVAQFRDEGTAVGAFTRNSGMVLLTKDYIIHDIYTIKFSEKFGSQAMAIFNDY